MEFNYGDIFDAVLALPPQDQPALIEVGDERTRTWGELQSRTNRLARALLERGISPGDKLAIYMENRLEYVEAVVALLKARLVHVNINFRYRAEELLHVVDHSDAAVVIFDTPRAPELAAIRGQLAKVRLFVEVGEEGEASLEGAEAFETLAGTGDDGPLAITRSGDDLWFLYTGGTTGKPKAVMIKQDVLFRVQGQNSIFAVYPKPPADLAEHLERAREHLRMGRRSLVSAPMMHAVGLYTTLFPLSYGVSVVVMRGGHFDAQAVLDAVDRFRVIRIAIVGDAMANPLVQALQAHRERWDLSSLEAVTSSGMALSRDNKIALIRLLPQLTVSDGLGASESPGMGYHVLTKDNVADQGEVRMSLPPSCRIFSADFSREVVPGSGEKGLFARSGLLAEGYYKDPEGTARTFPVINGVRYVVVGDWAEVLADGSVRFLGRGALCINTGGEKVYVEEVEEAIKRHPGVRDVAVVSVPDPRWGQAVTAVVELRAGYALDAESIRHQVRQLLASYKAPKHVVQTSQVARLATGKTDYAANRSFALAYLSLN